MKNKKAFYCFLLKISRKFKGIVMLLLFFNGFGIQAKEYIKEIVLDPINTFDEVPVEIIVNGYLRFETDVIITDTRAVYVNVEELFRKLGIYCIIENNGNILKGFIENESIRYTIDFDSKQIDRGDRTIISENGIVKELDAIYVETSIMNEAFGLNMLFNFRSLSIKLEADFELPLVKQARLEKIRKNVSKLQSKNEIVIDTAIGRNYHFFNGGALDWSVSSTQAKNEKVNNRFSLGFGSELLYGEAKVLFNYYDQTKFDRRQLYYNWRWVDNDNSVIKQAQVGKIGAQSIAYIGAPLVGASFNNSPNTVRKAKGTYTISEYTEPNWTVELYINDALVDYTQADASGLYIFKVPIVYGYTILKLKFFGPLGEELTEEKVMNTPYTFMPAGVLEYNVSGGILEDDEDSNFGRGEVNYGINRFITIGAGTEYLSSIATNPLIPFANIAFQPFSKMVINMEYAHNVSLKGLLNYNFGRSAFLEVDYSKFVEGQEATLNKTNEERRVRLSLPFKISKINATTKLSFNQLVYDVFNFNQADVLVSGRYKNYSANASIASNWINDNDPFMTSTLVLSSRLRNGLTLRPSLQYNITDNKMMRIRAEIEKRISKMSFSASYERNIQYATDNLFFSFKYDLPFARTGFSSSYNNDKFNFSETAQGSLAFGAGNGAITTGYNSSLGKGGIVCYPFLDLNQNGTMDKGEKIVLLSKVKVTGGKAIISEKDSIIRISDLNAFINYTVEFSDADLDNISWKFKHKTYQILVDPNQYKKVYVPIQVMGEVNGEVALQSNLGKEGQGRITLQIIDSKGAKVTEILSESDGYFSYLGLKPGNYSIKVDPEQLKKLNYQSSPEIQTFTIKESEDGTIIGGISFVLTDLETNTDSKSKEVQLIDSEKFINKSKELLKDTEAQKQRISWLLDKNINANYSPAFEIKELFYTVQIGAYKNYVTSKELQYLSPLFFEAVPNGFVRYVYGKFDTQKEANVGREIAIEKGFSNAFVVAYKNGEQVNANSLKKVKVTDKGNSEVRGKVEIKNQGKNEGIKNINLILLNKSGFIVGATTTDENGAYYFENLVPGDYTIKIVTNQLKEFYFESNPKTQNINVKTTNGVGIVTDLDFVIIKNKD